MLGLEGPSGGGEGCAVVGERLWAKASEDAEGAVEDSHDWGGEQSAKTIGGDGEVGDNPEGVGSGEVGEATGEGLDFGRGEAIQKKVS